jgi:hypothetical protein
VINFISNKIGVESFISDNIDFKFLDRKIISINENEFPKNTKFVKNESEQFLIRTNYFPGIKKSIIKALFEKYEIDGKVESISKEGNTVETESNVVKFWSYVPESRWEESLQTNTISIGWDEIGDILGKSKENITTDIKSKGLKKAAVASIDAQTNYDFLNTMSIGDIIIVKGGKNTYMAWGTITSDYFYDSNKSEFKKCRSVKWESVGNWTDTNKKWSPSKVIADITNYHAYLDNIINLLSIDSDDDIEVDEYIETKLNIAMPVFNPFGGERGSSAICITGESGVGKSYRVIKTLEANGHKFIREHLDPTSTGLLTQYILGKYERNSIGDFIVEAKSDPMNNYTIVLDECHKEGFIDRINAELLQCLSRRRNDGLRFFQTNKATDELFESLDKVNGVRIIPKNVGFILITSKPEVIHFNDDIRNRVDIVHLEREDRIDGYDIKSLMSKKSEPDDQV